jgi:integrase
MTRHPPTELKCDKATNRAFVRWMGRKIYFGVSGTRESTKAFSKWLADQCSEPPAPAPRSRLTVAQCVEQYLYHAERYYSQDGQPTGEFSNVCYALKSLLDHAGGPKDYAVEFGPRRLAAIQNAMSLEIDADTKEPRFSRNTINARVHRMRRCFRWCASQELIPASVVAALDMVPGLKSGRSVARETEPVRPVEIEIVQKTLPHLSPTVAAMVRVQLLCGMRPQDVCRMTGAAIDRTRDIWLYRPESHKNSHRGQSLVKAIPVSAQDVLRPFLRQSPTEPLFASADSNEYWRSQERKPHTQAVASRSRRFYATSSYGRAVLYGIARANKAGEKIPHWTPNQLRHLIASLIRRSSGIEAAQVFLGHAKMDATMIYAEQSEERLSEIARSLVSPLEQPSASG